jgi:hypothetical protein
MRVRGHEQNPRKRKAGIHRDVAAELIGEPLLQRSQIRVQPQTFLGAVVEIQGTHPQRIEHFC